MHDVMQFVPVSVSVRKLHFQEHRTVNQEVNVSGLHISSDEHCLGLVFTDYAGRHGLELRDEGNLFQPRFTYSLCL